MKKHYITPKTEINNLSVNVAVLLEVSKGEVDPTQGKPTVGEVKEETDWNIWSE